MKMHKDNMLGLPLDKKVEMFFSLNLSQADLERLSGVNENAIMVLSRSKGELFKTKARSVTVETAEKIETVVNRFIHDGKFKDVNPNTPDGMKLSQKMKYVLNIPISNTELAKELDVNIMVISKLRRGVTKIGRTRLRIASKFEKMFKNYLYTNVIQLVQKDVKTVASKKVDSSDIVKNIYKDLRSYRYGNYLVYDEENDIQNMELYNTIKDNIKNENYKFNIEHIDNEISDTFSIDFNFNISIINNGETTDYKVVNYQTKTPFGLFDSSVDNVAKV